MKTAEVSVMRPSGSSSTMTSSFEAGPKSSTEVKVEWNGYGFLVLSDSGTTLSRISDDLAFKNQKATFTLKKKVTITEGGSAISSTMERTIEVKRGVKATF